MKKVLLAMLIAVSAVSGCAKKGITEKNFPVIWQEYLRREFEESFDEKQSILQREEILTELLSSYNIPVKEFKSYLKKNHNDKYNRIFAE